ncbi:MAG TPA: Omp28-related outer membrane protein [Ignavibacteria bacterium]|nr:Omp28-related outer membrane protein [Ignavibacteria bacterium]
MKRTNLIIALLIFFMAAGISNSQFVRKVLFEEATNASCGPCAANNPALKSYIDAKGDSIIAIKYHASFPGTDAMYLHNPTQNAERYSSYYGMNAMPWLNSDGLVNDVWPFSLANLNNAFYGRLSVPAPLSITIVDTRIAGDSIRATVTVNIPSTLPSGNYKLRVMAIESWVINPVPQGTNGETVFEHVFRKDFPNTSGTVIAGSSGNFQYIFTYKVDPVWRDSSMHTVAFIQNDNNKEVLNAGSAPRGITGIDPVSGIAPNSFSLSQNYPNPFNPQTNIRFSLPKGSDVKITVFDAVGRVVALLANGRFEAGTYNIDFNASALSSGIYFYSITTAEFTDTKKMMLIK